MAVSESPENSTNVRSATIAAQPAARPAADPLERDPGLRDWAEEAAAVIARGFGGEAHAGAARVEPARAGGERRAAAGTADAGGAGAEPPPGALRGSPPPQEEPARHPAPAPRSIQLAPWYLRAGFATVGALAPSLASAWAERLFFTAPRPRASAEESAVLASARRGEVVVEGLRLGTWTWGEGPAVLFVHGWGGRGGQVHGFVPGLLAAGFSVVAFDGPGHGASEGALSSLPELARAARVVAATAPVRAVLAHSMGGPAAAIAMEGGLEVDAAVFVAPPFAVVDWVTPFSEALALPAKVREGMVRRAEARLHVRFAELTMARTAPRMTAPLLVVHDAKDKEVPHAAGAAIVARWPGARLHTTEGLGHKRILGDPDVIARAVAFLAEACGAARG